MKFDPWVNTERWHYDQQTHSLLIFNQTRDPRRLNDYTRWARRYLSHRIDGHVYATWLAIALYQRDEITHHKLRHKLKYYFQMIHDFSLILFIQNKRLDYDS